MGLGLMRMIFDVLQGQKLDVGRLFSQIHKVGTYLLAMLIVMLFRYPLMTLKVTAAIHWEAMRLFLKGVPVFRHRAAAASRARP